MKNPQTAPYLVDEQYEAKLKKVNDELTEKRIALTLPDLSPGQDNVLANNLSFSCYRVARFLFSKQGERTDVISPSCAVSNVSDTVIGFDKAQTAALDRIGLTIHCELIPAKNRYGSKCVIGSWWLTVTDQQKWQEAELKAQQAAA
jgi:hypothetical protein